MSHTKEEVDMAVAEFATVLGENAEVLMKHPEVAEFLMTLVKEVGTMEGTDEEKMVKIKSLADEYERAKRKCAI